MKTNEEFKKPPGEVKEVKYKNQLESIDSAYSNDQFSSMGRWTREEHEKFLSGKLLFSLLIVATL